MAARGTAMASDFDGTLCWSDWTTGEVHFDPANLEAVRRYQHEGGLFGICTGRPLQSVLETLEGILDLDFYIVTTGAQVLDADCNLLHERHIPRDVAQELFDGFESPSCTMIAVTEDEFVSVARPMPSLLPMVASLDEVRGELLGVSLEYMGDREAAHKACLQINSRFADVVEGFQNLGSVDVVPVGCSKGSGVRIVCEALGVQTIAGIGDSYNDLPLLNAADVAYTFHESPAEVRDAADVVVHTLAEALAHFME